MIGLWRARCTPVCIVVLGSPADLLATAFQGFRREARLTPGYARTDFQAEEELSSCLLSRSPLNSLFSPLSRSAPAVYATAAANQKALLSRAARHQMRRQK